MRMLAGRRESSDCLLASLSAGLGRGVMVTCGSSGRPSVAWAITGGTTGASAQTAASRQKDKPELRRLEKVCATLLPVSTGFSITPDPRTNEDLVVRSLSDQRTDVLLAEYRGVSDAHSGL